jgi:hypothetical protein
VRVGFDGEGDQQGRFCEVVVSEESFLELDEYLLVQLFGGHGVGEVIVEVVSRYERSFILDDIADALAYVVPASDRRFTEILFSLSVIGYFMIIDEYFADSGAFFHDDGFVVLNDAHIDAFLLYAEDIAILGYVSVMGCFAQFFV